MLGARHNDKIDVTGYLVPDSVGSTTGTAFATGSSNEPEVAGVGGAADPVATGTEGAPLTPSRVTGVATTTRSVPVVPIAVVL
jgi:hypothetical protein